MPRQVLNEKVKKLKDETMTLQKKVTDADDFAAGITAENERLKLRMKEMEANLEKATRQHEEMSEANKVRNPAFRTRSAELKKYTVFGAAFSKQIFHVRQRGHFL
jgi:predicted  nucleic acid-binding Zn-ribbon protein